MNEKQVGYTTSTVGDAPLEVSQYDAAAEFYARLCNNLPAIATGQAYQYAMRLADALDLEIERWEDKRPSNE
jgi:hypothetical protein